MLNRILSNKKIIYLFTFIVLILLHSLGFSNEAKEIGSLNSTNKTLFDLFQKGGIFMYPLLLLAAFAIGFSIERYIFFRKSKLNPIKFTIKLEKAIAEKSISEIKSLCKENDYLLSHIVLKGLKVNKLGYEKVEKILSVAGSIQVSALEKGLNILSSIGTIAPMVGFLGTTSGMISAFSDIAAADRVSAKIVAGGIEEALLTTAAGLLLAIPTLFSYNYFVHKIDIFVSNIERISSDIVEKLITEDSNEN